jgi:hypothetical protein
LAHAVKTAEDGAGRLLEQPGKFVDNGGQELALMDRSTHLSIDSE